MLSHIPARILKHTVTLHVCTGVDVWQSPTVQNIEVKNVCMQPSHETRKTSSNTEVVLRSLLFIDAWRSSPRNLDVQALQQASETSGLPMTLTFRGTKYTVLTVDTLFDDEGNYHHTEVGLV